MYILCVQAHSYRSFQGFICLMQISTRARDFLIDTIALRSDMQILNEVLADPNITKVRMFLHVFQVGPLLLWAMAITQKIRRNTGTFLSEKSVLDTKRTPQLTLNLYNKASSTVLCNRFISTCKKMLFLIYDKNRSIPNYSLTFEPRFCLN